ncbi:hypothetical protein [Cupriavidus basilensis]|uniref:hypothetical protein n=1 Tax=Cupriavidus basilensis TaxID=68895 RepID=UPI001185A249|nr:hypothetical protein [Cupriavidus basilensis]
MHQILVSPITTNDAPLPGARIGRRPRWTVSAGIQTLRHEAAKLRAAFQARMAQTDASALQDDATDLLQQAAILDRGAEVLALTSTT